MDNRLKSIFNRFAGREVDVRLGLNDPVLKSIDLIARSNGIEMKVWVPGGVQINATAQDSVNVHLGPIRHNKAKIRRITFGAN